MEFIPVNPTPVCDKLAHSHGHTHVYLYHGIAFQDTEAMVAARMMIIFCNIAASRPTAGPQRINGWPTRESSRTNAQFFACIAVLCVGRPMHSHTAYSDAASCVSEACANPGPSGCGVRSNYAKTVSTSNSGVCGDGWWKCVFSLFGGVDHMVISPGWRGSRVCCLVVYFTLLLAWIIRS